jgi:hypothetical protein
MDNFTTHWVAIATPALLLGVGGAVWRFRLWRRRRNQVSFRHLCGRSLRTAQQVQDALADTPPNQGIRLGQYLLPQRAAYGHFAIIGATGSGKTLLQRLLMQSVLPRIGKGLDQRALIYDAKQDLHSLLGGLGLRCPIATFHPLDDEGGGAKGPLLPTVRAPHDAERARPAHRAEPAGKAPAPTGPDQT